MGLNRSCAALLGALRCGPEGSIQLLQLAYAVAILVMPPLEAVLLLLEFGGVFAGGLRAVVLELRLGVLVKLSPLLGEPRVSSLHVHLMLGHLRGVAGHLLVMHISSSLRWRDWSSPV